MGKSFPLYVVDAFPTGNNDVFTGGPAAVVVLEYDDDIPDDSKQKLANSMNLSETAFVSLAWEKSGNETLKNQAHHSNSIRRTLRWFTPTEEIPLCGHATQAAAKALLKHYQILKKTENVIVERIEFQTKFKGTLSAFLKKENNSEMITISLPANPTKPIELCKANWVPGFLKTLLGPSFKDAAESVEDLQESPTLPHNLLVRLKRIPGELPSDTLSRIKNNPKELLEADSGPGQMRLVYVTIEGDGGTAGPDFYCRVFAPYFGIPEDPVTGSAQTLLIPYWTEKLFKPGQVLKIHQLSPRGGKFAGLWRDEEVTLTGTARVVVVGEVYL